MPNPPASPRGGMPPEFAVIFRSAGTAPGGHWSRLDQWAGAGLDWTELLPLAHAEGALPRIAELAALGAFPGMPDAVRSQLAMLERLHAFRAGVIEDLVRETAAAFADRQLSLLVLKGAALGSTVYRGFPDRPMGDLDLLVRRGEARQAVEVALAVGWSRVDGIPGAAFFDGHQHLPPLRDARGLGIGLDLHLHIVPSHAPFRLPVEDIWASATPASVLSEASAESNLEAAGIQVPSAEMLLLHACIHFAWSHGLSEGGWKVFRDVALILRSPLLDGDRFVTLANRAGALGAAYWTLHLAWVLGGVEQAEALCQELNVRPSGLRRRALTRHFSTVLSGGTSAELPARLTRVLWELALRPDREGHDGARPWDRDGLFQQESEAGPDSPFDAPRRLSRLWKTLAYLASLGPSAAVPLSKRE